MKIDLTVANTWLELRDALDGLEGASAVGVDVETTGLSSHNDDLLAVGVGATYSDTEGVAVVAPRELLKDANAQEILWNYIWRKSRRAVGHNFKFDMQFLAPLIGWPPDGALIGDTLLLSHLLDERPNRPDSRVRGLGLKDQVAVRYDHDYGFDFTVDRDAPDYWDKLHAYLGEDVVYTSRLWHDLRAEAETESPRLNSCHDELLVEASRTIAIAEFNGAPIDEDWTSETIRFLGRRQTRRRAALERAIKKMAFAKCNRVVDNVMSSTQIADVMYDDWGMTPDIRRHGVIKSGDRSTDKDHIQAAVAKYLGTDLDRQAKWLRSLQRLRRDVRTETTYRKSILDKRDNDGRLRANFMLHGTATGRLSSQGPNLQNIPAMDRVDSDKALPMRRAFRPTDGWLWVEVDYSQLELRVAAALSHDEAFTEVFTSGRDVHMEVATAIFNRPAEKIKKAERFLAKAIGFGIIYGRGAKALATGAEMRYAEQELGMTAWSVETAGAFIKKFLRSYPQLSAWIDTMHRDVPRQGYVESPFGRRRRFPLMPQHKGELGSIQRQAVNTPIQSAASDICLTAMGKIQRRLEDSHLRARVLFPVHDSICLEVHPDDVAALEQIARDCMEIEFEGVPLTVDFEYGPSWAEVKGG